MSISATLQLQWFPFRYVGFLVQQNDFECSNDTLNVLKRQTHICVTIMCGQTAYAGTSCLMDSHSNLIILNRFKITVLHFPIHSTFHSEHLLFNFLQMEPFSNTPEMWAWFLLITFRYPSLSDQSTSPTLHRLAFSIILLFWVRLSPIQHHLHHVLLE